MLFKIISPEDLIKYTAQDDSLLIDVRDKEDYDKEHIPGAIWADWETLEHEIDYIIADTMHIIDWIIIYCARGNTSLIVARDLARLGYPVISLGGGYRNWKAYMEHKNNKKQILPHQQISYK